MTSRTIPTPRGFLGQQNSSRPLWSQYRCQWSHLNDLSASWRPRQLSAHLSAFTITLSQYSSNGVAFLFWRSLTSSKWQEKARALCVIAGQYQFDICFPWRSITVIFCFPLSLCDSAARLRSGRWEVMNVARAQAGGKWWMATITPDHQWRLHKAAAQWKWLPEEFC